MQRVGLFVNISNQFSAISAEKKGYRVNYDKYLRLVKSLTGEDSQLVLSIAYGSQVNTEAVVFIQLLKNLGYITKFDASHLEKGRIIQPNRNVEITMDILEAQENLDVIVIGSNDCELIPLILRLKMTGKKVLVVTPYPMHNKGFLNYDCQETIDYIQVMRGDKK